MDSLLQGVGVFIGIVAGVIITILVQTYRAWRSEKQTLKNLEFEISLNVRRIDDWLEESNKWRNAVNSDSLQTYNGYFDLSKALFATANSMLATGSLYRHLDRDDIASLQLAGADLNANVQLLMNNHILYDKANFVKQDAAIHVDFWENKFKEHKANMQAIARKLK